MKNNFIRFGRKMGRYLATYLGCLNTFIWKICVFLQMILLSMIVLILFSSVYWRYFLNDPISWSEDAALLCMIWMTFLGVPVALRSGDHVAMEIVLQKFSDRTTAILRVGIGFVILSTSFIAVYYGTAFVNQGMARIVPSMDWLSQGYIYLALPTGFLLMIPIGFENILKPFVSSATITQEG